MNRIVATIFLALLAAGARAAYAPDGDAIVCVGGTNRWTRALYGTCAASRVETSDFPEMALYLDPKTAWSLEMPGLRVLERCEARYERGVRRYILTDSSRLGPEGRIEVTIAAVADGDGALAKIEAVGLAAPFSFETQYGRAKCRRFHRGGDYGRDPADGFCVDADDAASRVVTIASSETKYLGIPENPPDAARRFDIALDYAAAVASRLVIRTPDPYIDAIAPALSLAENGGWDDRLGVYMHGAVGWRMPLNGWRAGYMADLLGDHARARSHFRNYAASQVTNCPCALSPAMDPAKGHARPAETWGTPMYSDGYICRNPNNAAKLHHYDMNLAFIDALVWHLRSTGDREFARDMWPILARHLAWEARAFDADGDHLYDAVCCIWASDGLAYNGGAVTHSSAYNAFHNRAAAEIAEWIGENPSPYRAEADAIERAIASRLWAGDHWAEFADNMGRRMRHDSAAAWTEYTAIDCGVGTPAERRLAAKWMEANLPRKDVPGGAVVATTSWQPYRWSVNNVAMAEVMHTALAHWLADNDAEAMRLYKGMLMDSCYLGCGPGNFEQLSKHDLRQGECYRDFTDTTACTLRATIRGLFGISPDLARGIVEISPHFPPDWDFAELHTADIDFAMRKVEGRQVFDVVLHYPVPAKAVFKAPEIPATPEVAHNSGVAGSPVEPVHASFRPVDISAYCNDAVTNLYAAGKYLAPAWPHTTLRTPDSLLGDWCVPDEKFDMGETDARAVFTSLYDNYPDKVEIPLSGRAAQLRLTLVAAVNHMQYHVTNAVVRVAYADGTSESLALILPEKLAPANVRLVDTWSMPCANAHRERPRFGNLLGDVQYITLDPARELESLTLETWSNETVVGLAELAVSPKS